MVSTLRTLRGENINRCTVTPGGVCVATSNGVGVSNFTSRGRHGENAPLGSRLFSNTTTPRRCSSGFPLSSVASVCKFYTALFCTLANRVPGDTMRHHGSDQLLVDAAAMGELPPRIISTLTGNLRIRHRGHVASFSRLHSRLSITRATGTVRSRVSEATDVGLAGSRHAHGASGNVSRTSVVVVTTTVAILILNVTNIF